MAPSFHPRLINDPFDDPGLFVPFQFQHRALLFDLGDLTHLPAKDLLKTSHVFVSHTHMDHMVGFDRLLRLLLGRNKRLCLYGPTGFLRNIEGKLAGYSWNLVHNYDSQFTIHATEVATGHVTMQQYPCRGGFTQDKAPTPARFDGTLLREPGLTVSAAALDHGIPSLGFCMSERFHVNIRKQALLDLGLVVGPWLTTFKEALYAGQPSDALFDVPDGGDRSGVRPFALGDLTERIARITPGQRIAYIADAVHSRSNVETMVQLAGDVDHLFIEAAFLDRDRDMAGEKRHLTAGQAGQIAGIARAKRFTLFHFSPRYQGQAHLFHEEAQKAYQAAVE